jgi:hypothetical protein
MTSTCGISTLMLSLPTLAVVPDANLISVANAIQSQGATFGVTRLTKCKAAIGAKSVFVTKEPAIPLAPTYRSRMTLNSRRSSFGRLSFTCECLLTCLLKNQAQRRGKGPCSLASAATAYSECMLGVRYGPRASASVCQIGRKTVVIDFAHGSTRKSKKAR